MADMAFTGKYIVSAVPELIAADALGFRKSGAAHYQGNPNSKRMDFLVQIRLTKEDATSSEFLKLVAFLGNKENRLLVPASKLGFVSPDNAPNQVQLVNACNEGATQCVLGTQIPADRIGSYISINNELKMVSSSSVDTTASETTILFQPMMLSNNAIGSLVSIRNPQGAYIPQGNLNLSINRRTGNRLGITSNWRLVQA